MEALADAIPIQAPHAFDRTTRLMFDAGRRSDQQRKRSRQRLGPFRNDDISWHIHE
jgi:hypothetical protein